MKRWFVGGMLLVGLMGCGTATPEAPAVGANEFNAVPAVAVVTDDPTALITQYAETVLAGDIASAKGLVTNAQYDWSESTTHLVDDFQPVSYRIRDTATTTTGVTATIEWTNLPGEKTLCTDLRVRLGQLELDEQITHTCPEFMPKVMR